MWINSNISLQLRSILQHKLNISPFRKLCQIPSCRTCAMQQRRPSLRAQHASELSRRHLYAPRASVVPRRTCSACAPGRLDRGLCVSRHTDASVDRDLTREASTIHLVLRPGPSRARARRCGRVVGTVHRFDSAAFGKTPRLGVPPRCFPPESRPRRSSGCPPRRYPPSRNLASTTP